MAIRTYQTLDADLTAIAALTPANDDFIQRKSGVWVNRSVAQVVADLAIPAGAPTGADYLVGTANGGLSAEIVVGTSPGGELGGTWASPTVDATHAGSAHHTQSHDHSAAGDGTALHPASAAFGATPAGTGRIRLTQGSSEGIFGRNAANGGDVGLLAINSSDESELRAPARLHANAWNHIRASGAATGNDPVIEALGNDTDVDLDLRSQGAGLLRYNGTEISKVGHSHATDFGEAGDISAEAFGDTAAAGATGEVADAGHRHAMPADPVTAHAAAGDPHTGYRLESADHTHATTGLQAGTVAHSVLTGISATDHHVAPAAGPDAAITVDAAGAAGTASTFARSGHGHRVDTDSGVASTQAFGDAATAGTSGTIQRQGHKHAMPADPVTAHVAAGDPHTGYRLESADHTHATTGLQAGTLDHGLALTGLTDDDHTQYLKEEASGGVASEVPDHTHVSAAQAGAIKLDALVAPDDVTTLDASTSAHGLLKKLPGGTSTFLRGDGAFATPTASVAFTEFTKDLGAARRSGTFDITGLSGLTTDKPVQVMQTAAQIASKGDARDEAEMDAIVATGYVVSATTIRVYWQAPSVVVGTYAFAYLVGG